MFLPTTRQEMAALGWPQLDVILVTGDAYIDSPFIGVSLIGKLLLSQGFKVGIIAQPDVHSDQDITRQGAPLLFWGITGGCIDSMVALYADQKVDAVAAIESRGFVFAAPLADRLGIPLILIRKKGKLPGKTLSQKYLLEYGEAEIEIHPADVPAGSRVLVVDDLIATGGTLRAATDLVVAAGARVAGIFGVVGLPFLNYKAVLGSIPIRTLIEYHGE